MLTTAFLLVAKGTEAASPYLKSCSGLCRLLAQVGCILSHVLTSRQVVSCEAGRDEACAQSPGVLSLPGCQLQHACQLCITCSPWWLPCSCVHCLRI